MKPEVARLVVLNHRVSKCAEYVQLPQEVSSWMALTVKPHTCRCHNFSVLASCLMSINDAFRPSYTCSKYVMLLVVCDLRNASVRPPPLQGLST